MLKRFLLLTGLFCSISTIKAQNIDLPSTLNVEIDSVKKEKIIQSLNDLFVQIDLDSITDELLIKEEAELTKIVFENLTALAKNDTTQSFQKQLINFYPIDKNRYLLQVAYFQKDTIDNHAKLRLIYQLMAEITGDQIKFTTPLQYLTKDWHTTTIGRIQYFYRKDIQEKRAILFDKKNTIIAKKFGLAPESFKFYMTYNYQEILQLLGFVYDAAENGFTEYGYGVAANHIFAINDNEDFAHDIFHYYSEQVNETENRNWITEEGVAYLWGNAYYVDAQGEMINQSQLLEQLKTYLNANPKANLLTLFEDNPKIFANFSSKISTRSTISGVLCQEVYDKQGMKGLLKLINCGRKPSSMESFKQTLKELLNIDATNFHQRVMELITN